MNWENSIDVCRRHCVKRTASGELLYNTGSSAWSPVMPLRAGMRWGGKLKTEGGVCVYMGLTQAVYSRDQHSIMKKLYSNLKKKFLKLYLLKKKVSSLPYIFDS